MDIQFGPFIQDLHKCSACTFRDHEIEPLAPHPVIPPVPIMFIGENPSWADDQDVPFSASTISGQALDEYYLKPLNITREQVWITDLFKCRYPKDIYHSKEHENKIIQGVAETCARLWLVQEIEIARPRVIVTLSDKQVYQRLRRAFALRTPARFVLAVSTPYPVNLAGWPTLLFPMIHPDISRPVGDGDNRKITARDKWAVQHRKEHIPALKAVLEAENAEY